MKHSIEKQEAVVSALWDFVRDMQKHPDDGHQCTLARDGTTASLKHIGTALDKILAAFGYKKLEVQ